MQQKQESDSASRDEIVSENKATFPYTISFPDFEPSAAVTADIERYIAKLEKFSDRIISCHVAVRAPQIKSRTHIYHINVQVNIPGDQIVMTRESEKDYDHSKIHLAVRDTFKAIERQLRDIHSRAVKHARMADPVNARIQAEGDLDTVTDILAANRVDNLTV